MSAPEPIRVIVAGAAGRMGEAVCAAVRLAGDMHLHARVDPALTGERERGSSAAHDRGRSHGDDGGPELPLEVALDGADVLIDFTAPGAVLGNVRRALAAGVHVVAGTTGFDLTELEHICAARAGPRRANVVVAPNFAIGAVLMMRYASDAARHMAKAEIIELHHDRKLDAPSGTAARTAELMRQAASRAGSRGEGDARRTDAPSPPIHSVRLPGLVAHQEVILGDLGQTLTIRHDTTSREAFMPGVLLAVRRVAHVERSPLVGLEHLLD